MDYAKTIYANNGIKAQCTTTDLYMKWRFWVDVNFDSLLLVSKQSKTIGQQ